MPIAIDRTKFPLVVVSFRDAPSVEEFNAYLSQLDAVYTLQRPFALVVDSIGAEAPSAKHRKLQADWLRRNEAGIRKYNRGTAFVLDSVLTRGALTAILWLQPLPCPHLVCAELGEALRWARERLET